MRPHGCKFGRLAWVVFAWMTIFVAGVVQAANMVLWEDKRMAGIDLVVPADWLPIEGSTGDKGGWFTGRADKPEATVAILQKEVVDEVINNIQVEIMEKEVVNGQKVIVYEGDNKKGDFRLKILVFEGGPAEKKHPVVMVGARDWNEYRPILEKITASLKFGRPPLEPDGDRPPVPEPIVPPSKDEQKPPTTVSATNDLETQKVLFLEIIDQLRLLEESDYDGFDRLYRQMIEKCPDLDETRDAYWGLSSLYLEAYDPPKTKEAVKLLKEFLSKYPGSILAKKVEQRLSEIDLSKIGPPRVEPGKTEPPKTEPPKTEPPKTEPPKTEPPRDEPPKVEPPRDEPPKVEPPKVEPPKVEPPKVEPPKVEPPKDEPPKDEPPKDEPPKVEPPKDEPPKDEPPKDEPPKVEPLKDEPPKVEPPKDKPPKVEPPKVEPPKVEPPKVEPPKVEPPRVEPRIIDPNRVEASFKLLNKKAFSDYVGPYEQLAPNGYPEVKFRLLLSAPGRKIRALQIGKLDGQPPGWDTIPGNDSWLIAVVKDGLVINQTDGHVDLDLGSSQVILDLYLHDDNSVSLGKTDYQVTIFFEDGFRYQSEFKISDYK